MANSFEIAKKINTMVTNDPLIIEFQRLEARVGDELRQLDKEIRKAQKTMTESFGKPNFDKNRDTYTALKTKFDNNPIYMQYFELKKEVTDYLKILEKTIKKDL